MKCKFEQLSWGCADMTAKVTLMGAVSFVAVLVAATGCAGGSSPAPAPSSPRVATIAGPPSGAPSASVDPQAKAYAEAERAYRAWFDAMAQLRRRGGANVQAVSPYVSQGRALVIAQNLAQLYTERGWRSVGDATIRSVKPRSYTPAGASGSAKVTVVGCEDSSGAKLVDRDGQPAALPPSGAPHLFSDTVDVIQQADSRWVVDNADTAPVTTC